MTTTSNQPIMHRTVSGAGSLLSVGSSPALNRLGWQSVQTDVEAQLVGPRFSKWLHDIPKVDLHAHLNGSISPQLLNQLIAERNERERLAGRPDEALIPGISETDEALKQLSEPKDRMNYCFKAFDAIYKVVDNLEYTVLVVEDVLCSYAAENTMYLELRTSLREMRRTAAADASQPLASRREYVDTVYTTIHQVLEQGPSAAACERYYQLRPAWQMELSLADYSEFLGDALRNMTVRLLLSINRAASVAVAQETISIARAIKQEPQPEATDTRSSTVNALPTRLVGIDFCGNCYQGNFADFVPVLQDAVAHGLELSLHAGEKDDAEETAQMIAVNPARFGHLVFVSDEHMAQIKELKVPIEFCITSNMLTGGLAGPHQHHLDDWFFTPRNDSFDKANAATATPDIQILGPSTNASIVGANASNASIAASASGVTSRPHTPPSNHLTPRRLIDCDHRSVHPLSINTDDRGVFYTSLSRELSLFAKFLLHKLMERSDPAARSEFTVPSVLEWLGQAVVAVQRDALTQGLMLASDELTFLEDSFDRRASQCLLVPELRL